MVYPHVTEISRAGTGALALAPTERTLAALLLRVDAASRWRLAQSTIHADQARIPRLTHRAQS